MLTIGKLGAGQEHYYLDAVAERAEEYYLFAGEAPGQWAGGGSRALGLSAEVAGSAFTALLRGEDPATGLPLSAQPGKVPGFDLTFSAPKSVSILFALAAPDLAQRMARAHAEAVTQAFGYMEEVASHGRRGHAGGLRIRTDGFVAATFRHRTSRAGDPNLHTHVVVVNRVLGVDGRWSALDARELYQQARTAGHLYQAALRHELRDLPLTWTVGRNGLGEIDQVPRAVRREFSRRRVEIERLLGERGLSSPSAAQAAALDSRISKGRDVREHASLVVDWSQRAASLGFDAARLPAARTSTEVDLDLERLLGPEGLTASASTFGEREVMRAVSRALPAGAPVDEVRRLTRRALAGSSVVPLAERSGRGADVKDRPLALGMSQRRYTTRELLILEQALVVGAEAVRQGSAAVASAADVSVALDQHPTLSPEQRDLVHSLTLTPDGVQVVNAPAGSGKTTALAAVVAAYTAGGSRVVGTTLSAKAAGVLRDQAGLPTFTLTRFLSDLRRGGGDLPPGIVVLVDEASQVGTRALAEIFGAVRRARGKLVLVGDPHQLPEIAAGGAYRGLIARLPVVELTANHRQRDPADRDRLTELRRGNAATAVASYDDAGLVVRATTSDALREQLVADWAAAFRAPDPDALMLALTNHDMDDLNDRARQVLQARGDLTGPHVTFGGRTFQVGDVVVTRRNDRRRGVLNGQRWTVRAVGDDGLVLEPLDRAGAGVAVTRSYLDRPGSVQHGYAVTVAVSQGSSVERTFILGSDRTYREAGYTAASRAREETRFYVVGRQPLETEDGPSRSDADPAEIFAEALRRSAAQDLAIDTWSDAEPSYLDERG